MRRPFASLVVALFVSAFAPAPAYSAATIFCVANDANLNLHIKGVSKRVSVLVEGFVLELVGEEVFHKAETPAEGQYFGDMIFDNRDRLTIKSEFYDPDFVFEAFLANTGEGQGGIVWQGAYKITFVDRKDEAPLRGTIYCIDGY